MARRSRKTSEVLITGDKVDPRYRGKIAKDEPQVKAAENIARRPRKIPKVIDVTGQNRGSAVSSAESELAALEMEFGMRPTAPLPKPEDADGPAPMMEPIQPETPDKKALNWTEIEHDSDQPDGRLVVDEPMSRDKGAPDLIYDQKAKSNDPDLVYDERTGPLSPDMVPGEAPAKPVPDLAPPAAKPTPAEPKAKAEAKSAPVPKSAPKSAPKPAPKRKTKARARKKNLPNPALQSRALAETVVTSMVGRMKTEATKKGGMLTIADINALDSEFKSETQALSLAFEKSFEAYVRARERAISGEKRDFPFDRLIVRKFSHLFDEDKEGHFDTVSRRMLPGFFMALNMMLGAEVVEEYQEKCRRMVEVSREDGKDDVNWNAIYESDEGSLAGLDALVAIAAHFDDFERRREWFITLVNGHLTPISDANKDESGWEMTESGFHRFLTALLADLNALVDTDDGKAQIRKRYGGDVSNSVVRLLRRLASMENSFALPAVAGGRRTDDRVVEVVFSFCRSAAC